MRMQFRKHHKYMLLGINKNGLHEKHGEVVSFRECRTDICRDDKDFLSMIITKLTYESSTEIFFQKGSNDNDKNT